MKKDLVNITKKILGSAAQSVLLRPIIKNIFGRRIAIIYYHFIGDYAPSYYKDFFAQKTLQDLEKDIIFLKRYFEFAPLSRVIEQNSKHSSQTKPLLAVTFDDGFDLIRNGVLDLLESHKICATVFVITSCLDNKNLMWRNKLVAIRAHKDKCLYVPEYNNLMSKYGLAQIKNGSQLLTASINWPYVLKEKIIDELWVMCDMAPINEYLEEHRPYLTVFQLRELLKRGHSIGLHTHTHYSCSKLDSDGVEIEIKKPAQYLRQKFGCPSIPFSYPFGDRLTSQTEYDLFRDGIFTCALGVEGFSKRGISSYRLGRAGCEAGIRFPIFGKTLAELFLTRNMKPN